MSDFETKNPTISVVMGVFNGGEHLRAAIESILTQTYRDFEFIIIDDGSTDNSLDIILSFKDPRIKLIKQDNHGLVYTLNKGIKHARGTYIARQDADDISLPSRLDKELALLTSNPKVGLVGTFFTYIDEHSSMPSSVTITTPTKSIDLYRHLYINNPFAHGSTLFRKEAWLKAGGYTNNYGPTEDFELWRRIAHDWELAQIPEALYWYRLNSQGISNKKQALQHKFTAKIIEEQWSKPFIGKGYRAIIEDGKYYQSLDSMYSNIIYRNYIHQQVLITRGQFYRLHLRAGIIAAIAIARLDSRAGISLIRPAIGSFLRKVGLRKNNK